MRADGKYEEAVGQWIRNCWPSNPGYSRKEKISIQMSPTPATQMHLKAGKSMQKVS